MFRKKHWVVLSAVFVMLISACKSGVKTGDTPKERLEGYISQSFNVTGIEDREALSQFLSGTARTRLAAWSDEQFREAFIDSKRQFIKLIFSESKDVSPTEIRITYELTFLDQGKGHDAKVTHKKLAQLTKDRDRWMIAEVRNLKEMIEYKNEMSLP